MKRVGVFAIVFLCLLALVGAAFASTGGSYELSWWTVDGGGGASSGGGYALIGTIGQPDAGLMSGGSYGLLGGFWGHAFEVLIDLYLPIIMR